MRKILAFKRTILAIFLVLAIGSGFLLPNLKFSFDFSQFFPEGDEDLIFYQEFIKEFGVDDSFLLVAVENEGSVFEKDFLSRFNDLTQASKNIPYVIENQSLTTLSYPLKTAFGYTKLPIIRLNDSTKYAADWEKIQEDDLFVNTLIDEEKSSLVLSLETIDKLDYAQSIELLTSLRQLLKEHGFEEYHLLGRAYFYEALIAMQKEELIKTSIAATLLVLFILFLVYRRTLVVTITMISIILALVLFLGLLSLLGKELNSLASFYPILILIVGTSDVIHILDDYLSKLRNCLEKHDAMLRTLKEVGISTLLTSVTTAIGFASLLTSKSSVVSGFGVNSAIGVLIAFITIIFFTCPLLLLVKKEKVLPKNGVSIKWTTGLSQVNNFTKKYPNKILTLSAVFTIICIWGITKVNTNYQIKESLPKGSAIANDFDFFQSNYGGFRPLEVAITTEGQFKITDFKVTQEIEKVAQYLKSVAPIKNVQSVNIFYKGLHKANNLNKSEFFVLPEKAETFEKYKNEIKKLARKPFSKYVNAEETKSRISAKVLDVGLDTLNTVYKKFYDFTAMNTDTTMVKFKLTGTGILLDKNAFYVKDSLIQGLLLGLLIVALLMALLFKNLKLLLISLLPNMLPLLFAAALLGFLGIPLEATISVVFAIVFGIAVDDTIHFLGRYKIGISKGLTKEEALKVTFLETGRALVITTLILFFGFLVLLISVHTPSFTIGLLISVTLLTALIIDLLLLPVLIRKML
ncbi:MMPL family transporter [Aurantibacter crassamenti]|uniref:efflux RND transporter permease subunit n=1 Tax=Aurantibacter crassamenti TaxID=1837375 RepID=UPI00193A0D43|nr:MMPL family transporter [Aurantibacter crassamenti]MBM1107649.1 MMPL family transporter [Aurantibacter crassamenti]